MSASAKPRDSLLGRIITALGFSKGYNFTLWFLFCGSLIGFTLARFQYLNINGVFCGGGATGAAPGECYHYRSGVGRAGIIIHLAAILPAAFLACFQFIPIIRRQFLVFHRTNGYIVIFLALTANVGALLIARHAFGGDLSTQMVVGVLAILTTSSLAISYANIKLLQIDQHRAWMIRAWFYFGSIITTRLIMIISAMVITQNGSYTQARPCRQILDVFEGDVGKTLSRYPDCTSAFNGADPERMVLVKANFKGGAEEVGVSLAVPFGAAIWLALAIHAVGVELYLGLTPRENERLRTISYQKQLEAGMLEPGSAGLTAQRFGDANGWNPRDEQHEFIPPLFVLHTTIYIT
ncbi:hypothetical protein DFS34DRAFT_643755 [Phlyctochytrium arcticum]|nr:hypothetical protein DFS34DRAFT_643755 [Phlyctochytrium arcticum]